MGLVLSRDSAAVVVGIKNFRAAVRDAGVAAGTAGIEGRVAPLCEGSVMVRGYEKRFRLFAAVRP